MNKIKTNLAYTDPTGKPVLSQVFAFDPKEDEIVEVRDLIVTEGYPLMEAGVHAVAALPNPDAEMVEWLTSGAITLDADGQMVGDPSVMAWLDGVRLMGRAW